MPTDDCRSVTVLKFMMTIRKRAATGVLTLLLVSIAAPGTCFGWEPSAAARFACCQQAHHADCSDQLSADACCAGQEQSRQPAPQLTSPSATLSAHAGVIAFAGGLAFLDTNPPNARALLIRDIGADSLHSPPGFSRPPLRI